MFHPVYRRIECLCRTNLRVLRHTFQRSNHVVTSRNDSISIFVEFKTHTNFVNCIYICSFQLNSKLFFGIFLNFLLQTSDKEIKPIFFSRKSRQIRSTPQKEFINKSISRSILKDRHDLPKALFHQLFSSFFSHLECSLFSQLECSMSKMMKQREHPQFRQICIQ